MLGESIVDLGLQQVAMKCSEIVGSEVEISTSYCKYPDTALKVNIRWNEAGSLVPCNYTITLSDVLIHSSIVSVEEMIVIGFKRRVSS